MVNSRSPVSRADLRRIIMSAIVGVAIGVAVGAALPFIAQSLIADLLPVRARVALYAQPLATAAAFDAVS